MQERLGWQVEVLPQGKHARPEHRFWSATGPVAPTPQAEVETRERTGTTPLGDPQHRDLQLLNRLRGGRYLQAIKRLLIAGVDRLPHSRREQPGPAEKNVSRRAENCGEPLVKRTISSLAIRSVDPSRSSFIREASLS